MARGRQYRQRVSPTEWWTTPIRVTRCAALVAAGGRCKRTTFRHPYCLQHLQRLCGVRIARSTVPNAGCGLFAARPLAAGDAVVPYTGVFHGRGAPAVRPETPYMFRYGGGQLMDATAVRGAAGYANRPPRDGSGTRSNLRAVVATLRPADVDPATGAVTSRRLRQAGWRRVPPALVRDFAGRSLVWFVAAAAVPAGAELFVPYNAGAANLAVVHHTVPAAC